MDIERITARAGQRVMSQGGAVYEGAEVPGGRVTGITAVLDREYEVLDENGIAFHTTAISVEVSAVPKSREGDEITRGGQSWRVNRTLEDDGHIRVLEVYG